MKTVKWLLAVCAAAGASAPCAAAGASAPCAAARAASAAEDIRALKAVISSNSVDSTVKCRYYRAWYLDQCTKAEREAILDRNVAAHRRWMELKPDDVRPHADLGIVLVIGGRRDEAEKELRIALDGEKRLDWTTRAKVRWSLAECLWRKDDRDGAKKLIAEIVAMKDDNPPENLPFVHGVARYLHRAWTDPDGDLDEFKLPHSVDGRPYPAPQKEEYGDERVSLAKVELRVVTGGTGRTSGTGVAGLASPAGLSGLDDPIVRLLKRKLQRFGSKFAPGGTVVELSLSPDAPVAKPQGYSLDVAPGSVRVRARTRLGLTWGVVSLLQCVDRGDSKPSKPQAPELPEPSIRTLRIEDWPVCQRRGAINYWYPDYLEYALFNKMSSLQMHVMAKHSWSILFSSLERVRARLWVRRFRDFGISYYWSDRSLTVSPVLPLSSPRTRAMQLSWMRCAAAVGASICYDMDDERFYPIPLHPLDVAAAGSAARLDSKYITELYREVKKDFPDFRMTFGTPFYFGPDGGTGKTWYPEDRKEYLRSHREFLDPEIDVYWSGPRVKSYGFTPEKIKWMSDLIGRKPVVFHNSDCVGRHNHVSYGADVPNYKGSHCPETFDLIAGFYKNSSRYEEACQMGPAMDWCWNPEAHDAATATRRGIEMLEGPGVFEIVAEATPSLAHFDRYAYGEPRSELFSEEQADLDRRVSEGERAWSNVCAIAKNGGLFVSGFRKSGLRYAKRLAGYLRNPPKWLLEKRDAEMANTKFAKEDVGFDESKGDLFFPAELMSGGFYHRTGDYSGRGVRGIKYVNVGEELSVTFSCEPFPPESSPRLFVCGEAFREDRPVLEILVNGRSIWRGEAFRTHHFKVMEAEIPAYALVRSGNRLVLRNVSPESENWRKPLIHYFVIRIREQGLRRP